MNTVVSRSVQSVISELSAQRLELAPEGWRQCVEKLAEGYAEVVGGHVYCLNCDGVLHGAQGHEVHCVTMVARRMLANEPLIHAYLSVDPMECNGQPGSARRFPKPVRRNYRSYSTPRTLSRRAHAEYMVPTFLQAKHPARKS
jgi:hypothetical protein